MPKSRTEKEQTVKELSDKLRRMKSVVLTGYSGLSVPDATALRKKLRSEGVDYCVAKKTLLVRALAECSVSYPEIESMEGGIGLAFGYDDEVAPARLLREFQKEHEVVTFRGGIVNSVIYSQSEVAALAELPSRIQLLGSLVGTLAAPISGFLNVAAGPLRSFMNVLTAKSKATS